MSAPISDDLLRRLRCPVCRVDSAPLARSEGAELVCEADGCGRSFPVLDGVPILLDDRTGVARLSDYPPARAARRKAPGGPLFVQRIRYRLRKLRKRLRRLRPYLPALSRNLAARRNYRRLARLLLAEGPRPWVLVVGGRWQGQGLADLQREAAITLVDTDIALGPETRLVCDLHNLPFVGGSFDGAVAQAVLEHVADPPQCAAELHRVLTASGLVYAETPFMQQVHSGAFDFTRFTPLGHRRLFRDFQEIDSGAACGPGMALAWAWKYFLLSFASGRRARALLARFAEWTAFWLKYLDPLLVRKDAALDAASAVYFLGRRSDRRVADRELADLYRGCT